MLRNRIILIIAFVATTALFLLWRISTQPRLQCLSAGPKHRYSFSKGPTNDATGLLVEDSIGASDGIVLGVGARFSGQHLVLPGGDPDVAAYFALPRGLLSISSTNNGGTGEFSIEGWVKITGEQRWCQFFDFGSSGVRNGPGIEVIGPGGTHEGLDYLTYSAQIDHNRKARRLELRNEDPPGGGIKTADTTVRDPTEAMRHFVVSWEEKTGKIEAYENGIQTAALSVTNAMSDINDVNIWIGRSQWHDNNLEGELYELRIYDHVLTHAEIELNEKLGAHKLLVPPPIASDDKITLNPGCSALVPVTRNDRGTGIDPNSIVVNSPPSSGQARIRDGKILYTHNGVSKWDKFQYTVKDKLGNTSQAANVFITISDSRRIDNATLTISNKPPSNRYEIVDAFPGLRFENPLALRSPPGLSNRVFVVERRGVVSYVSDVSSPAPQYRILLDISDRVLFDEAPLGELGLQSIAFHPGFATNGVFFVFYTARGSPYSDRLSRFCAIKTWTENSLPDRLQADTSTEQILLDIPDREFNHNAGDLHFGPDGYLYVSLGDEGGQMNLYENAQRIDRNFFSGIMRIDVDQLPGSLRPHYNVAIVTNRDGLAYFSVPPDNPFIGITNFNGALVNPSRVREEFWAVGLRNPWRMSFDQVTGELWAPDTGQDTYEEVDLIVRGGNYGWAFREGSQRTPGTPTEHIPEPPADFASIDPVWQYRHTSQAPDPAFAGNAVIGGNVYRGATMPELYGWYVFGDFVSGNIWALLDQKGSVQVKRLAGEAGISAYGVDPRNGDILLASYIKNKIERLVKPSITITNFPPLLSKTGIFADLQTLTPNPGILEYEPNVSFWSDYASKRRWFTVPAGKRIGFRANTNWIFPSGMIWVKHFEIEMVRGDSKTKRRLETRVLVKTEEGVFGVSYKWNQQQTDATLVSEAGEIFPLEIEADNGPLSQLWEIPSRASCLACHTPAGGFALGFNTRQLNRSGPMFTTSENQINALLEAGYLDAPKIDVKSLSFFVGLSDTNKSLTDRVRSYLAVNCSQCHQAEGSAPSTWDARPTLSLQDTRLINGLPRNYGTDTTNRLVVPGDPDHSILLMRLKGSSNFSRMPPLASHMPDLVAADLVEKWIKTQLVQSTKN